jgi:hypothetical protein
MNWRRIVQGVVTSGLTLGYNSGDQGLYNLSGGILTAIGSEERAETASMDIGGPEFVGVSGTGLFNQTGGTNTLSPTSEESGLAQLFLGLNAGSTGTYLLSGTGSLAVQGTEFIGYGGVGVFNQTGGTNTLTEVKSGSIYSPDAVNNGYLSIALLVQNGASFSNLDNFGVLSIQGVTVTAQTLNNSGRICLTDPPGGNGFGQLLLSGDYAQSSAGELDIALAGLTAGSQYSVLNVAGTATLDGALDISLAEGFTPIPGDVFDIVDAGSLTGTFSTLNFPAGDGVFDISYSSTGVELSFVVPEPCSVSLMTASALVLLTRRRRRRIPKNG